MRLSEALDIVISRTGHHRYRELCDPANPDYNPAYIPVVISLATDEPAPIAAQPAYYPSFGAQIMNAIGAAVGFVADGCKTVDEETAQRRLAICKGCPSFDAEQLRCKECGCFMAIKTYARSEGCPVGKW